MKKPKARSQATLFAESPVQTDSGATGGAGLGHGVEYQADAFIYYLLDLISRVVSASAAASHSAYVQIEPRHTDGTKVVRMDLFIGSDAVTLEAKANPSDPDIVAFVSAAARALDQNQSRTARLLSGTYTSSKLKSLRQLIRIGVEARGEDDRFHDLLKHEKVKHATELLACLGAGPAHKLVRMEVNVLPDFALRELVDIRLRDLVAPQHRDELRQLVFEPATRGMQDRTTVFAKEVIRNLDQRQIPLRCERQTDNEELGDVVAAVLFILQTCPTPLPVSVIADTCNLRVDQIRVEMANQIAAGNLIESNSEWVISPLVRRRIGHERAGEFLASAVTALSSFIQANTSNQLGLAQLDNAISLADECRNVEPQGCLELFHSLQGHLKRRGDKQLVLRAAELTIQAARSAKAIDTAAKYREAEAIVCGLSWVFQRIDRLNEAEAYALESLAIGEHVQWPRNTAFCQKCRGRLRRIQAERSSHKSTRRKLLKESVDLLHTAIQAFSANTAEFGPKHPEVGDCYSLLGRTYLALDDLGAAEAAANKAARLITRPESKDFMDLEVLQGDLAVRKLKFKEALKRYDNAILLAGSGNAERSEIAARALLQKAICLNSFGSNEWNEPLTQAERIWIELDEEYMTSHAQWTRLKLEGRVPKNQLRRLEVETPMVRVEVVRLIEEKLRSATQQSILAHRAEISDAEIRNLITDANRTIELRHRDW